MLDSNSKHKNHYGVKRNNQLKGHLLKFSMGMLVAWGVTELYRANLDEIGLDQRPYSVSDVYQHTTMHE